MAECVKSNASQEVASISGEHPDDDPASSDHDIDVEDVDDDCSDADSLPKSLESAKKRRMTPLSSEEVDDVEDPPAESPPVLGSGAKKSKKSSKNAPAPNPMIKPRCNCDYLRSVDCHLETKDLWDKFNELGTEMIITKTGRSAKSF